MAYKITGVYKYSFHHSNYQKVKSLLTNKLNRALDNFFVKEVSKFSINPLFLEDALPKLPIEKSHLEVSIVFSGEIKENISEKVILKNLKAADASNYKGELLSATVRLENDKEKIYFREENNGKVFINKYLI